MAKKLKSVGLHHVQQFISEHKSRIHEQIRNPLLFEYGKVFGRSYYELHIQAFLEEFKVHKELDYALLVLNHYKSYTFIHELYTRLNLERFEDASLKNASVHARRDIQKSIFYLFVFYLQGISQEQKEQIHNRLFRLYFLHMLSTVNRQRNIVLNYQNLSNALLKGKNARLKESFYAEDDGAVFKLLLNGKPLFEFQGKSVKTLRKKAYKKLFYDLIDDNITI